MWAVANLPADRTRTGCWARPELAGTVAAWTGLHRSSYRDTGAGAAALPPVYQVYEAHADAECGSTTETPDAARRLRTL
jgi:hypothetical protein